MGKFMEIAKRDHNSQTKIFQNAFVIWNILRLFNSKNDRRDETTLEVKRMTRL